MKTNTKKKVKKEIESIGTQILLNNHQLYSMKMSKRELETHLKRQMSSDLTNFIVNNLEELPVVFKEEKDERNFDTHYIMETTLISKERLHELLAKERALDKLQYDRWSNFFID